MLLGKKDFATVVLDEMCTLFVCKSYYDMETQNRLVFLNVFKNHDITKTSTPNTHTHTLKILLKKNMSPCLVFCVL